MVLKYTAAARDAGLGVVFITHNPHHAYLVGNHFIILKLGKRVLDKKRSEVTLEELTAEMAGGRELAELSHELQTADPTTRGHPVHRVPAKGVFTVSPFENIDRDGSADLLTLSWGRTTCLHQFTRITAPLPDPQSPHTKGPDMTTITDPEALPRRRPITGRRAADGAALEGRARRSPGTATGPPTCSTRPPGG